MRSCPRCAREYPEVAGADAQRCPHCGHETPTARAPPAPPGAPVDAASAAAVGLAVFRRRYAPILLLWTPAFIAEVAGGLLLLQYEAWLGRPLDFQGVSGLPLQDQLRLAGVALPLVVLAYGVQLAMWSRIGWFVARTLGAADVRPPPTGAAFGLGLALALLYLAGVLMLVVPFLVFFHWFLFAPAALAQAGRGAGGALEASRRFAKERRTYGFTALTIFLLVGASFLSALLGLVALAALAAAGFESSAASVVVGAFANWLVLPVVAVLPAAYYALARRAPEARPVDPASPAAERFRTTKCPGCGTLVPYTATGQPVDVTCPVCGRAGRVL